MKPSEKAMPSQPVYTMGQDRPEEICQIPPADLEEREIIHNMPARSYGIGSILRRYAGLPEGFPAQVSVEHCVKYKNEVINPWEVTAGYRTILAIDEERSALYQKAGVPRALPIGFAMHYAIRLYEAQHGRLPRPSQRHGTLVFPHKSSPVMKGRVFDHEPMIKWMDALPEEYHPIQVCLYWKDYLKGDAKPYEDAGYKVVSAGYWLHEDFFLRFIELCSQFRYTAANSFSGSLPQTVSCGCQFIYVQTGGHLELTEGKTIVHESDPTLNSEVGRAALPITTFPPVDEHFARQVALVRTMSGYNHIRSRWRLWWLLRQEARHTLSQRGDGLDFTNGMIKWEKIRPWLSRGLEQDGWLHTHLELLMPRRSQVATLTIELDLPGWSNLPRQMLHVTAPGIKKKATFKLKPGRYLLRIPLKPQKKDALVQMDWDSQFPMPGEERTVTCRLVRFHITSGSPETAEAVKLEPLPATA